MSEEAPAPGLFASIIRAAFVKAFTAERVEAEAEAYAVKFVKETIADAMRTYSGTGKALKEALTKALRVNNLDLPSYGHVVSEILARQIHASVATVVAGKLAEDMQGLLSLAPKEAKLSDLIAELLGDQDDDCCSPASVHMEIEWSEYSSAYVYISRDKPTHKHLNEVRLWIVLPKNCDDYESGETIAGKITGGHVNGSDLKKDIRFGYGTEHKNQRTEFGAWFGFEQRILAMYAVGTVITLDEDDCVLDKHDY